MNKYAALISMAFGIAKAVEEELPAGSGKDKLDLGLAVGGLAFETEKSLRTSWGDPQKFATALQGTIGAVVKAFNAVGIFRKSK
jgi:hypothetical protein